MSACACVFVHALVCLCVCRTSNKPDVASVEAVMEPNGKKGEEGRGGGGEAVASQILWSWVESGVCLWPGLGFG